MMNYRHGEPMGGYAASVAETTTSTFVPASLQPRRVIGLQHSSSKATLRLDWRGVLGRLKTKEEELTTEYVDGPLTDTCSSATGSSGQLVDHQRDLLESTYDRV